ncbi:MAG: hypothetical protein V3U62_01165 [Sedimenticolaceae bacterium]
MTTIQAELSIPTINIEKPAAISHFPFPISHFPFPISTGYQGIHHRLHRKFSALDCKLKVLAPEIEGGVPAANALGSAISMPSQTSAGRY